MFDFSEVVDAAALVRQIADDKGPYSVDFRKLVLLAVIANQLKRSADANEEMLRMFKEDRGE